MYNVKYTMVVSPPSVATRPLAGVAPLHRRRRRRWRGGISPKAKFRSSTKPNCTLALPALHNSLCEIPMKYPRKLKNALEKRGGGDYNLGVGIFFLNHGKGQYDAEVFVIDPPQGGIITISGADAQHIGKSLRMAVGEELTVCRNGVDYRCEIIGITREDVSL